MNNKPGLILALPRSGTNWTVDVLKAGNTRILQEPLWLHNGGSYEQNPLHPMRASTSQDISAEFGHQALKDDPYGQLLIKNFLDWVNQDDGQTHLFKETDGFFHLDWLLKAFPELKILLIQRDVRGIVSSFKKNGLFEKWHYRTRLQELLRTIRASSELDTLYGGTINQKNINTEPWIALTYYLGVSMLEIRRRIRGILDNVLTVTYEDMLANPEDNFRNVADKLGVNAVDAIIAKTRKTIGEDRAESTHSTRKRKNRDDFEQSLSTREAADIQSIWKSLGLEIDQVPRTFIGPDVNWARGKSHHYVTCESANRDDILQQYRANRIKFPGDKNVWTTKTLVTNAEYAIFINWLQENGLPISINGRNIFYNDRPQSKIHLVDGSTVINAGFETHPATHMNLIGSVSFAKWLGGRLPTSEELKEICFSKHDGTFDENLDKNQANFGHHYPGTTPVGYFPNNSLGIYDPVGNVGVWTSEKFQVDDGSASELEYTRMCGGWSKDEEECHFEGTKRGRPWWMAASTLGLRPIFDTIDTMPSQDSALDKITSLLNDLQDKTLTPREKNQIVHNYITA